MKFIETTTVDLNAGLDGVFARRLITPPIAVAPPAQLLESELTLGNRYVELFEGNRETSTKTQHLQAHLQLSKSFRQAEKNTHTMPLTLQSQSLSTAPAKIIGNISIQSVTIAGITAMRITVPPGSSWSKDLKAHAGTESCQSRHTGYMLSGTLAVRMDVGEERHFSEGTVFVVPPGHDAWSVGEQTAVFIEWSEVVEK
jgi:quercetin dioxygenase-like cupin family protein